MREALLVFLFIFGFYGGSQAYVASLEALTQDAERIPLDEFESLWLYTKQILRDKYKAKFFQIQTPTLVMLKLTSVPGIKQESWALDVFAFACRRTSAVAYGKDPKFGVLCGGEVRIYGVKTQKPFSLEIERYIGREAMVEIDCDCAYLYKRENYLKEKSLQKPDQVFLREQAKSYAEKIIKGLGWLEVIPQDDYGP